MKCTMEKIVFMLFLYVAVMACRRNGYAAICAQNFRAQHDSVTFLIQRAYGTHIDTALLEKALSMTDALLKADTSRSNKVFCHYSRCIIYTSLGKTDEAMRSRLFMVQSMTEDNPERLTYMAAVKTIEKSDSAAYYLTRLDEVCDSNLQKGFNENIVLYKIKAIYLRDGEAKAKDYLQEQVSKHPESAVLPYMLNQWDDFMSDNRRDMDEMRTFIGNAAR